MKNLTSNQLRTMYLAFFREKGHAVIPSSSLIPENDPTVLFTTAGMHPLVPYLLGEKHPEGKRLVNVQKCIRTGDIDDVGDASHCTFFEMLGNWSLGDYFKKDAIAYSFEFLTSKKYLNLPLDVLHFTCFEGDENAPRDDESAKLWMRHGVAKDHIYFLGKEHNWWGPAGVTGPCGPDTEIFIDTGKQPCGKDCNPSCSCGKFLEIWNDVFMQYNKTVDGKFEPLVQQNVDTGMGLDRTIATLQGKKSVYDTDAFEKIIAKIETLSGKKYADTDEEELKAFRIIADHIRCATFILGDSIGVTPSNMDQGYVLRRLIRRAIRFSLNISIAQGSLPAIASTVIGQYKHAYPELIDNEKRILDELAKEEQRFQRTIRQGLKEFDKLVARLEGNKIDGKAAFRLYDTFGFPLEFTLELAKENGYTVDESGFKTAFEQHQKISAAGAEQRFKGGLADSSEVATKLHTATHLMHDALGKVLGGEVMQRGSNITPERLRFDFGFDRKVTREELDQVEGVVNEAIKKDIAITLEEMSVADAKKAGAIGVFDDKYGNVVKVYTMGDYSKEICGGPHTSSTGTLGKFKIQKEQSSSAGVRRIKAVLLDEQLF